MTNSIGGVAANQLPEGLYELLNTDSLDSLLSNASDLHPVFAAIDDEDSSDFLSRHVANAVRQALEAAKPT